ncbi:MAG TPA: protein-L-isoaspartate O-methyltransferase [Rhodanobacteraceae bacterium]|nr:protein-L-isoaspartate O-methyltransferase [Rhodanobacteraceae bacterium]
MPTTSMDQAHLNMVNSQVRGWDVVDARVLDVLGLVTRADFVPPAWRHLAYVDLPVPLGHGETMMKPVVEGRMLQALNLLPDDEVLEIGTGSGYVTACLAKLSRSVTSVELRDGFATSARQRLRNAGVGNAEIVVADAVQDWQPPQPVDALVVTGAVAELPGRWRDWLKPEGRAFVICGQPPSMRALLLQRGENDQWHETRLFETDLPYLLHAEAQARFSL